MRVVFRTDASLQIGTGHVMRCLTLATRLADRGAQVDFICRAHQGNLIGLVEQRIWRNYVTIRIWGRQSIPGPTHACPLVGL